MEIGNLRIFKDMKYEALYWALGYEELDKGIFIKRYKDLEVKIYLNTGEVDFNNKISIVNGNKFLLNNHKSFVVLECINKLLEMGYKASEIILDLNNEYDIYLKDLYIKCFEWDKEEDDKTNIKVDNIKSIVYSSRLVSGVIERRTKIKVNNMTYDLGIFENDKKLDNYKLSNYKVLESKDFIIKSGVAISYIGNDEKVIVPEGVVSLSSSLFWDNQKIKEVILPKSLINLGGDTFYNCFNLEKVNIPSDCKFMGNNPFGGCKKLNLINQSKHFKYINDALYNEDFSRIIYFKISSSKERIEIDPRCKIIGKHCFYLCNNLKEINIPKSVIKLENNPFSGCEQLKLINNSEYYHIEDDVIYDGDYNSVIGCLNSIKTECLKLKNAKRICRNSFWNCKNIECIVLPETLEEIGYNPFVGCKNIEFISNSKNFIVENHALYNKDKSKLICYPSKFAVDEVYLPEETIKLERGAFSGCDKMKDIHLHNVSIISKTCFSNCNSLNKVYLSDLVSYVGEWTFSHCENLKEVSIYKDTFIDKNAFLNSNVEVKVRNELSNYVIESDNLYTLRSMINNYKNKIKSIVIDPPYDSKIDYIGYKDDYGNSYMEFMLERMRTAKELLSNDGFLVINIDEGSLSKLKVFCENLFYKVRICKWEKLNPYFDKNRDVNPNKKEVLYEYIIICYKSKESKLNLIKQPYIENDILKEKDSEVPDIFCNFGTNSSAKDEMKEIFGDRKYFTTPKPLKLIKELIRATSSKDSIILDFFAGSGTTGHATIDLNKEDLGSRKYILISNNESNICKNVTLKRIQKYDSNIIFLN